MECMRRWRLGSVSVGGTWTCAEAYACAEALSISSLIACRVSISALNVLSSASCASSAACSTRTQSGGASTRSQRERPASCVKRCSHTVSLHTHTHTQASHFPSVGTTTPYRPTLGHGTSMAPLGDKHGSFGGPKPDPYLSCALPPCDRCAT